MNDSNSRIPEDMVPEVLELASRFYAESNHSYSLAELQQAGKEVQIPPEYMEKAIAHLSDRRRIQQEQERQAKERRQKVQVVTAGVAVAIALWGVLTYNSLSTVSQNVEAKWAQVENQLQRRADLIPNLVSVTKAQVQQEKEIVEMLLRSREAYFQATNFADRQVAIGEMNTAIQQFDRYAAGNPQLQSSQAYRDLRYEIAGTENRIAVERKRYNEAVQLYNQKVRSFPNVLVASLTGFKPKPFFQAQITAAPQIE